MCLGSESTDCARPLSAPLARAQGGQHYQVENIRSFCFNTQFLVSIADGVYPYDASGGPPAEGQRLAMLFTYGKRCKDHMHYGDMDVGDATKKQEAAMCLKMAVGTWDGTTMGFRVSKNPTTNFKAWGIMEPADPENEAMLEAAHLCEGRAVLDRKAEAEGQAVLNIAQRAFWCANWPRTYRDDDDDPLQDTRGGGDEEQNARQRFVFKQLNYREHVEKVTAGPRRDDEPNVSWVELCNFEVDKFKAIYQFPDDTAPFYVIECKWKNPDCHDGSVIHVKSGKIVHGDYEFVFVEVNIQLDKIKTKGELNVAFSTAFPLLSGHNLDVPEFMQLMNDLPKPPISNAIVKFGRQPSGLYVMQNCAFQDGLIYTHAESKVHVISQLFTRFNLDPSQYPKMTIIPFPHVRYHILCELWNNTMPKFFSTNTIAAKAVFCLGIMGVHAEKFWKGEGGVCKFPVAWLHSTSPGTGKTYAAMLVSAMFGRGESLFAGSSTTVAIQTRLDVIASSTLCIDDYVPPTGKDKAWAEVTRQVYDHQGRAIGGDNQRMFIPESGLMVTSNSILCEDDSAVQSRILVLPFDQMPKSNGLPELQSALGLISAVLPDMDTLTHEGVLDCQVMGDVSTFLHLAVGEIQDRKVGMWAWLLYHMLLVSHMCQSVDGEAGAIIEWVVQQCRDSSHETKNTQSTMRRFVIALSKVMPGGEMAGSALADKTNAVVYWHNLRTNFDHDGVPHYAVRVQSVCSAIRAKTGDRFAYVGTIKALLQTEGIVASSTVQFADAGHSWPLYKTLEDHGPKIALREDEIVGDLLTAADQNAVLIPCAMFRDIVAEWQSGESAGGADYKKILILPHGSNLHASKVPECDFSYNFYDMATAEAFDPVSGEPLPPFIYRALHTTTFAPYCGATNLAEYVKIEKPDLYGSEEQRNARWDPDVEAMNRDKGFGSVDETMELSTIDMYFGTSVPKLSALPPAYTKVCHYMRDDPDDEAVQDPCTFHPDVESFPSPKIRK
ncbi:MAG: hypothetical protein OSB10_03700, partial [Planctomycetota bacterium]|nr:hypothetical protein [Planctomycetota bacterium]